MIDQRARTDWVLDLREHHNCSGPDGLRLVNATASGTVHGYTVESQRRSRHTHLGVCIRLTAPDGRRLDLVGDASFTDTNARTPTSQTLSRSVAWAFKDSATPEQAQMAARRIEAVIAAGHDCLRRGVTGAEARGLIQSVAEGIAPETVEAWQAAFHTPGGGSVLSVRQVLWLSEAGFTPQTTRAWFLSYDSVAVGTKTGVAERARFRDAGWTPAQMLNFARGRDPRSVGDWAALGPERADLAVRAGLSAREAKQMARRGTWDAAALSTLAGLLTHQHSG